MHQTWLSNYSWKEAEESLNSLPQFITKTTVSGFGDLDIQFVHSPSTAALNGEKSIPLLFLHGWPGSIIEVSKALPIFNEKGIDVVAPSLPGWLSSTLPREKGFKIKHHAEVVHKLMLKLGYKKYVLQGGDWGGEIAPTLATMYPESILGMHVNYFPVHPEPRFASKEEKDAEEKGYSAFEKNSLDRFREWKKNGTAYVQIQQFKPLMLGIGLHDSPMGLLAWIADKVFDWSDSFPRNAEGYKWSHEELITWTLIQYFSDMGPAGPFQMYVENRFESEGGEWEGNRRKYVEVQTGVSALRWENEMVPRKWAEREANVIWWREHGRGGHFAVYEMPEEMVQDVVEFVDSLGISGYT
jgi:pimeloyl-ACP methyl ester carboxylesterase